ncbi:CaiB/BaiF CoA-transferase family protein [Streptomyces sp. DH37]|uniref:CaiB/BaiF CoA transferase family protein n=1 Tax=Streptomyces sp. DH37 TaxID=3040122 RepID=UPI002441333B|nr:CoA transferase [Streptomyces sp. DH37]MDG9701975.1 CoA transferase [Streptomyces sp. DH37]
MTRASTPEDGRDHLTGHERAAPMRPGPTGPLRGVRVIDLTRAVSGPFCTMILADLGAEVIKVEPPSGDLPRFSGPFTKDDTTRGIGGLFGSINRNKLGIVLDLTTPADRERLLRLTDTADVLVENYRAGVMERWGLQYEALHERNPGLVYASIRGFGDPRTGRSPYVDWPAYDIVAQAMGGLISMTGPSEGETVRVGPTIGDLYPATLSAIGILAAVIHARATGEGQMVDVAMVDSIVSLCETAVYRYSYTGAVSRPTGNGHPQLVPFDVYPTKDGECAIAAPTDNHWKLLCEAMGRPELVDDERTRTNGDRVANARLVQSAVRRWAAERTTGEIVGELGGRVPVGPVNDAADLFADPHLRARDMLVAVDQPAGARPVVLPNCPIRFTATPSGVYRRSPLLGEHTAEVLARLDADAGAADSGLRNPPPETVRDDGP